MLTISSVINIEWFREDLCFGIAAVQLKTLKKQGWSILTVSQHALCD